jgi:hypothetical protein
MQPSLMPSNPIKDDIWTLIIYKDSVRTAQ